MKTNALITFTQRKLPDYTRDDIREFYDEIQKTVFKKAVELMRYLDTSTGKDPVLTTVAGTYQYSLSVATVGANIQEISNVYDGDYSYIYYDQTNTGYRGIRANVRQGINSASPAIVTFSSDPGDNDYSITCYRFPTSITAETIQLEIPDQWHMSHMFMGVVGLAESLQHDGYSNLYQLFNTTLLPELQHSFDTEAHKINKFYEGQGY